MCDCKVGPGKFEGEGPLTFLMRERSLSGAGGDTLDYGDGSWAELELAPIDKPSTEEWDAMLAQGYCDECIANVETEVPAGGAVTYGEDSQGFAWSTVWASADKAQAAFDADAADLADAEGDDDEASL